MRWRKDPVITYTVREVYDILRERQEALDQRVRNIESLIEHIKEYRALREHWRQWLIPVLITVVMMIIAIFQVFHVPGF